MNTVLLFAILFAAVVVLLIVIITIAVVAIVLRKPTAKEVLPPENLSIDLVALQLDPIAEGGPTIEVYGVPVRLVALVLAPAGRNVALPDAKGIRPICERLLPGLASVVDFQRPIFRRWPQQLSSHGFAQSFFANMLMPGDRGIGTPWSGVAGRFESGQGNMVAGLIFLATEPNSIGQLTIEQPGMWNDGLRVRSGA